MLPSFLAKGSEPATGAVVGAAEAKGDAPVGAAGAAIGAVAGVTAGVGLPKMDWACPAC